LLTFDIALADADPLGVNQNVTFDEVGGLDDREYFLALLKFFFTIALRYKCFKRDDSFTAPVSRGVPTI